MTTDPTPADLRLAAFRDAGTALGMLRGQRAARTATEDAAFAHAYQEAAHAQLKTFGLCKCPPGDWAITVDRAALERAQTRAEQLAEEKSKLWRQLEESQGERRTLEIKIHGAMDFINESPDATAAEIETAMRDIFGWAPKVSPADVNTSMAAVASALEASAPDELTGQIGRSS